MVKENENILAELGNSVKVSVSKKDTNGKVYSSLIIGKFIKFSQNNKNENVVVLMGIEKGEKRCQLKVVPFKYIESFNRTRLTGDIKKVIDYAFKNYLNSRGVEAKAIDRKNIYWYNKGRFQDRYDEISDYMPGSGRDTDNKYLNALLILGKYYYDVYNNGGCNLMSDGVWKGLLDNEEERRILREMNKEGIIKTINFNVQSDTLYRYLIDEDKLENVMNEFLYNTRDKDFKATLYTVYQNFDKELVSRNKHDGEGWSDVSFSNNTEKERWYKHRIDNFGFKEVE